jgi:hypothetical protein
MSSRIDSEHAAERHEERSHAGAWERGFSGRESSYLEVGKLFPTCSLVMFTQFS